MLQLNSYGTLRLLLLLLLSVPTLSTDKSHADVERFNADIRV